MPLAIIENLDLEKPSFGPSKWPRKLKPAKNSKLPKWPENCFEPFGKGGWPSISTWIITEKKPEVSHLKIFGCPLFVHIPKEKRTKLDPLGKKGIFDGYCEVSKAFRIYILGYHHIEINRDVTFDEDATLKRSRKCHLEEVYEEEPVAPRVAEPVK
jgi:hypothetical protein